MKILATVLALALVAPPAPAQVFTPDTYVLTHTYDLDATAYTYCATTGINGTTTDRNRQPPRGADRVSAAASTTVTSDGSLSSFNNVAVGDVLFINVITPTAGTGTPPTAVGRTEMRAVMARASANSITISGAAITLVGSSFTFRKLACGTADTSGAIPLSGADKFTFQVTLTQENSTSTDYKVQCRLHGAAWSDVNGPNNDVTTFNDIFATDLLFDECRVGAQVNTDDGGDTGANAEQLTILVTRLR